MRQQLLWRYPFSYYLIAAIFVILMVAVTGLIGISYLATEQTLQENARALELQTEDSLITVFRSKEEGLRIFDDSLNARLEESFPLFLTEYERSGRDPGAMDLEAVQRELGEEVDLYVIDANATIIATTYTPDLGLQFRDYAPYFAEYLDRIRVSDGMHPDRVVSAKTTGEMKKYAYYPTPDHRYILELGLTVESAPVASFGYLDQDLIAQVEQANSYLVKARVFDTTLRERVNDTSVEINDPALKALLAGVLANRTSTTVPGQAAGITTRYLFVDLGNDNYGSDLSRIIELTYSDQPIKDALASSISFYVTLGLLALAGCAVLAVVSIRGLTRPIGKMVEDINIIAGGDLDHPLAPPVGEEMINLEESISAMVGRLKGTIADLRVSQENYRTLVEGANSVILWSDRDGRIRFINTFGQKFFEFPEQEILGKTVFETIHSGTDEQGRSYAEKYRKFFDDPGQFQYIESENRTRSGRRVWMSWTNTPLYSGEGEIVGSLSVGNDISRLKQVEHELQTSEENYRTLVESATSIILRFSPDGVIRFINTYGSEFFGYPPDEIVGKSIFGTILPETDPSGRSMSEMYPYLLDHPALFGNRETENRTRNGSRVWMSWTNTFLRNDQGEITEILSIGNDISRLKEVEREIQALNSELEQRVAERTWQLVDVNRNLESFTYSVSHDLRAPLRAISGYSTILLTDLPEISGKDRKYLELIRQNAHDMGRLIDDLLNFSKLGRQSLQKNLIDPTALAREIIGELRNDPANRAVEFQMSSLPSCHADRVLFRQVLANLLSNAVKFSRNRDRPLIEIGSDIREGKQVYFVRDNGVGFDMRYADKIFGVFQRLHDDGEYEGTGVGLAIVRRIVDLHGGSIWVESVVGTGTTFYFTCGN